MPTQKSQIQYLKHENHELRELLELHRRSLQRAVAVMKLVNKDSAILLRVRRVEGDLATISRETEKTVLIASRDLEAVLANYEKGWEPPSLPRRKM